MASNAPNDRAANPVEPESPQKAGNVAVQTKRAREENAAEMSAMRRMPEVRSEKNMDFVLQFRPD